MVCFVNITGGCVATEFVTIGTAGLELGAQVSNESSSGAFDGAMNSNYGLRRQGR